MTETNHDTNGIRSTLQSYFTGYLDALPEELERAFHPESALHSAGETGLERTPSPEFVAGVRARASRGEKRQAQPEIESIDVTGDAASAKVRLRFAGFSFVDYLSLLKLSGQWRIVSKTYTKTV